MVYNILKDFSIDTIGTITGIIQDGMQNNNDISANILQNIDNISELCYTNICRLVIYNYNKSNKETADYYVIIIIKKIN